METGQFEVKFKKQEGADLLLSIYPLCSRQCFANAQLYLYVLLTIEGVYKGAAAYV